MISKPNESGNGVELLEKVLDDKNLIRYHYITKISLIWLRDKAKVGPIEVFGIQGMMSSQVLAFSRVKSDFVTAK
jgi:hypothetical protein